MLYHHKYCIFQPHFTRIYLHFTCILPAFYLHFTCILPPFYRRSYAHFTCILVARLQLLYIRRMA